MLPADYVTELDRYAGTTDPTWGAVLVAELTRADQAS